jgi:hypothetical protein
MSTANTAPDPAYPVADVLYRFGLSIAGLLALIQQVLPRVANPPVPWPDLYNYISRTRRRFERLLARLAAGIAPRARAPRPDDAPAAEPKPRAKPRFRLPRRRLWLRALLGYNAGNFAGQVAYLLDQPETAALIAASTQARRLLRPFFHILGTPPACIPPLPRPPRKPRPKPPPKQKRLTRRELEALLWYPNIEGRPMKLIPPRKYRY